MRHIRLLLLPLVLAWVGEASATTTEDRLRACAAIDAPQRRLQCYDSVVTTLAGPGPAQGGSTATPPSAPTTTDQGANPEAAFGKEHWEGERETASIAARVSAVSRDAYGKLVVALDNGQVWRQNKTEKVHIAVDDRIVIERGMLSSFFFQVNEGNRKIKFTRVQ
ncbi:MAG: hypothetical protein KDI01_00205 [Halioglobus sp.]|nr:hypothetical protein [Halioglobus sp.]